MSMTETTLSDVEVSEAAIPQGWQCCLLCGRTLTDRALHDALEEPVLAAIRAEHPEWSSVDGACQPCVNHYRNLLRERLTREARLHVKPESRWPIWANKLFGTRWRLDRRA
jgi:hypothetical protein